MKNIIKNFIKNIRCLYLIYNFLFSLIINIIGVFVKINEKQALFVVYGGKRYDDSPKFIYEKIKKDEKFKDIKCIWAFIEPQKYDFINENEKIKIDTFKYYLTVLKSKYWITNSSVKRGLSINKKGHIDVFFPHGLTGIKKVGIDMDNNNKSFKSTKQEKFDMIFLGGSKEKTILTKAWQTEEENFFTTGLPRNDELYNVKAEDIEKCREKLKIPKGKKVILYAPTYREFYTDKSFNNIIVNPFDFKELKDQLSDEYVFVITAHYQVGKLLNIPKDDDFVINAFDYPYINDLLIIADILISDYSSVIWDYAILERPIICFGYDYEKYIKERGTYFDLNKIYCDGVVKNQKELINVIKNIDLKKEIEHVKRIKSEYLIANPNSTELITNMIFKEFIYETAN